MEFHEKLQELRKKKGLTQEELAEALYVSRTAISKWESGRGYPSIDSLREISNFFSVSIDELLSGDKLLTLAERENKSNMQSMCDLLFGMVDICSILLIVLPIYPNTIKGYVYSVNLVDYTQNNPLLRILYWILFLGLIISGMIKSLLILKKIRTGQKVLTLFSIGFSVVAVISLSMARESYAIVIVFLLLLLKGILLKKPCA